MAHLPERAVFYTSVLPLLAYYGLFASVIYPIAGSLHPMDLMNSLMGSVPTGESGRQAGRHVTNLHHGFDGEHLSTITVLRCTCLPHDVCN